MRLVEDAMELTALVMFVAGVAALALAAGAA